MFEKNFQRARPDMVQSLAAVRALRVLLARDLRDLRDLKTLSRLWPTVHLKRAAQQVEPPAPPRPTALQGVRNRNHLRTRWPLLLLQDRWES